MNDLAMTNTGYVPKRDPRNYPLERTQRPLDTAGHSPFVAPIDGLPILMQAKRPTCTSHAAAWAKMQYDMAHTGQFRVLSRRFLHILSKQSTAKPGDGRAISDVLNVMHKFGVPEESVFPEPDASMSDADYEDPTSITPEVYANAALHKIGSFHFLADLSLEGLKNAIFQNQIVIVGMDISDAWWTKADGTISWAAEDVDPIRPPSPATSRHSVDLYAFNNQENLLALVNSWSDAWVGSGTAFFYQNELPFIYEAAVITG